MIFLSDEIRRNFIFQQCRALIKLWRNFFFSKRKHPPDGNLTQFDPSFLIHPSLADHEGLTAKNSELVPCPFSFLPFQKRWLHKTNFLVWEFLVKKNLVLEENYQLGSSGFCYFIVVNKCRLWREKIGDFNLFHTNFAIKIFFELFM